MSDFDSAMANLRQVLIAIDTDGDGVPDTMVPANQGVVTSRQPAQEPPARPYRMPPSTMYGLDPSEDMSGGTGPDYEGGRKFLNLLGVTGAAAADPFGIPSAALGMVVPGARDAWRSYQASDPVAATVGGMAGGFGAAGAAFRGVRGLGDAVGRGAALGAGSDVLDAGAGVPNAIGPGTAFKATLGGSMSLPMRYGIPVAGTAIGANSLMSPAQAASPLEDRLRAMSPDQLRQYQTMIGVTPDGVLGPQTKLRAQIYEDQQANSSANKDAENQRAIARETARIEAEARGRAAESAATAKAQSEIRAQDAQRPFLQRNPDYQNYALPLAGAAAIGLPMLQQALLRRGATAGVRTASQGVNDTARAYSSAPNATNARSLSSANSLYDDAVTAVPPPSNLPSLPEAGLIAGAAAAPSLAMTAPYLFDYAQGTGSPAKEAARGEFTFDGWKERLFGPTAAGAALAGLGYGLGRAGSRAFINPAPSGAALATARSTSDMVRSAPDDVALTQNINTLLQGAQQNAMSLKGLQGVQAARPPVVRFDDANLPAPVADPPIPPRPGPGGGGGGGGEPTPNPQPRPRNSQGASGGQSVPYGSPQQNSLRPFVDSEVLAGRGVPAQPQLDRALQAAGVPVPTSGPYAQRATNIADYVAEMQAAGMTPQQMVAELQRARSRGAQILGIGGAAGMTANSLMDPSYSGDY
jgi:hypothetical protein